MEVIKHYVPMTPEQVNEAAEAMAVLILEHIKANRKRAAEAKKQLDCMSQSPAEGNGVR